MAKIVVLTQEPGIVEWVREQVPIFAESILREIDYDKPKLVILNEIEHDDDIRDAFWMDDIFITAMKIPVYQQNIICSQGALFIQIDFKHIYHPKSIEDCDEDYKLTLEEIKSMEPSMYYIQVQRLDD